MEAIIWVTDEYCEDVREEESICYNTHQNLLSSPWKQTTNKAQTFVHRHRLLFGIL